VEGYILLDLSEVLRSSKSKLVNRSLSSGSGIFGIKISEFSGVLVNDREFANALAKKLESDLGVKGYISTDELPAYGISKAEKKAIEDLADAGEGDVVIMVIDSEEKAVLALDIIEKEARYYRQ
jgi:Glu-tRNA(Gln) amidotransferase subunit E-like FAD-binding protein